MYTDRKPTIDENIYEKNIAGYGFGSIVFSYPREISLNEKLSTFNTSNHNISYQIGENYMLIQNFSSGKNFPNLIFNLKDQFGEILNKNFIEITG